ncbi:MAG TPA: condensation domain-containing protein, partial [Pyrinomonadaceae bacterium]|nr:condensation domain-containing protein [Pyrinomonadaceae bacterium]
MTEPITNHDTAAANLEDLYELSPMQQGMLFHTLYAPKLGIYFEQSIFTIEGDFDRAAFQRAWQEVVNRHPILRTGFVWDGLEKPLQFVYRNVNVEIEEHDWLSLDAQRQQEMLEEFVRDDQQRGFELTRPPLMRLTLFRTGARDYKFVWSRHHLVLDRWSRSLVLQDFLASYSAFSKGREPELEETRPYRDYIDWLLKQDQAKAEAFWRRSLSGFESPTHLRLGSSRPAEKDTYDRVSAQLSSEHTSALRNFAREQKLTMNTVVQGAWSLLLSRYSREREVLFGATVAGRPADLPGVNSMVGLFINTLPVRVEVEPQASLLSWLRTLQENLAEQRQYEYSSLIDIQGWSDIPRGVPLFESILVFENLPAESSFRETDSNLLMRGDRSVGAKTNYPLTVMVNPGAEVTIGAIYDRGHFDADMIQQLLDHFVVLLKQFPLAGHRSVSEISLLEAAERDRLVNEWNQTAQIFAEEACVHELIERQVELHGPDVALVFGARQLTYEELNARANQLAGYLTSKLPAGHADRLVGIYLDRGPEMVIAVLAVLKAGAA